MKNASSDQQGCLVLAFGAHPDDIDLSVGGMLCKVSRKGHRAVAVDMTAGEAGTRGTAETRRKEAKKAAAILGLAARENLGLPDAGLEFCLENRRAAAALIRRYRPGIVLAPWIEDSHPDHAAAGQIVKAALFDARLKKVAIEGEPWFVTTILFYPCRHYHQPTVVIDISGEHDIKKKAFEAHRSQMDGKGKKKIRPKGVADPFAVSEVRDRHYGSLIGTAYGEGLISPQPLALFSLDLLTDPDGP